MLYREEEVRLPEVEERQPWIYTYGDLLTLLLCFFILFSANSNKNKEQIKSGISYGLRGGPPASPFFFEGAQNIIPQENAGAGKTNAIGNLIVGADVMVDDRGIMVSLNEQVAFPSGSSVLSAQAKAILQEFARLIRSLPNSVVIEGHTDDIPIATAQFPSNWFLSSARASSVAQELESLGVNPKRMEVVGYAATRPRVANLDNKSREINRRIDILIKPDDGPP